MNQGLMLSSNELLKFANTFFNAFEQKDLQIVSGYFSQDITLSDPITEQINGKEAVVKTIKEIFSQNNSIHVKNRTFHTDPDQQSITAELEIVFNNHQRLNLVDVIELNAEGLIQSVRAYFDTRQMHTN